MSPERTNRNISNPGLQLDKPGQDTFLDHDFIQRKGRHIPDLSLEGEAVFEYKTVEDFIRTHVRAVNDMTMREKEAEAKAERIFAAQYMPLQPPDLYSSE